MDKVMCERKKKVTDANGKGDLRGKKTIDQ